MSEIKGTHWQIIKALCQSLLTCLSVFPKLLVNIASGGRLLKVTHTNNSVQRFDCRETKSSVSVSLACEDNLAPKARKWKEDIVTRHGLGLSNHTLHRVCFCSNQQITVPSLGGCTKMHVVYPCSSRSGLDLRCSVQPTCRVRIKAWV